MKKLGEELGMNFEGGLAGLTEGLDGRAKEPSAEPEAALPPPGDTSRAAMPKAKSNGADPQPDRS